MSASASPGSVGVAICEAAVATPSSAAAGLHDERIIAAEFEQWLAAR